MKQARLDHQCMIAGVTCLLNSVKPFGYTLRDNFKLTLSKHKQMPRVHHN